MRRTLVAGAVTVFAGLTLAGTAAADHNEPDPPPEPPQQSEPEPQPEPRPEPKPRPEPEPPAQGGAHEIPPVPQPHYHPDFGPPPCTDAADACIDLSEHQTWLMRDGKVIYGPVPITHGKPGYITPTGTYQVTFKDIDHRSSIYNNAPMPFSVFFNGGIAFHEGSLEVPSHGCIHLSHAAAETYFYELQPGEIVQVYR